MNTLISHPNRKCDSVKCTNSQSMLWLIVGGCGHSLHVECNLPKISECQVCKDFLRSKISLLGKTANSNMLWFRQSLTDHILEATHRMKNPCEEVVKNLFKKIIYKFERKKQKNDVQSSSRLTLMFIHSLLIHFTQRTNFMHSYWSRAKM